MLFTCLDIEKKIEKINFILKTAPTYIFQFDIRLVKKDYINNRLYRNRN